MMMMMMEILVTNMKLGVSSLMKTKKSNNETIVGVFNEDRVSSLSLDHNLWDWSNWTNQ